MTAGRPKRPALFCPDVQRNIVGRRPPPRLPKVAWTLIRCPSSEAKGARCLANRVRNTLVSIGSYLVIALVTLAGLEIVLRVADFRELRETLSESSLAYDFDAELGWLPVPGSAGTMKSFRTTHYKHNSLGLRDEEPSLDGKPTIVFLGDSFVWGLDSEADERFSDLLKSRIPDRSEER